MQKKVCIVPVCYNAAEDTIHFLNSVERSFVSCSGVKLDVILADNSTKSSELDLSTLVYSFLYRYQKNDNIGYFPAFNKAISILPEKLSNYDFIIVCNVDLTMGEDFFSELLGFKLKSKVGLLAPAIISEKDGRDLNPKMMHRPSVSKINFMRLVCSHVLFFRLYQKVVRIREVLQALKQKKESKLSSTSAIASRQKIYGAHGSFMVFTRNYFTVGAEIYYPRFLFGEEGFVAEQLRMHDLEIEHVPSLKIFDKEHVSTSQVKLEFICAEHKKSYDYFYKNFLEERSE